ncbi:MAG: DUF1365 family protein [Hyphomicrobiaceae bacterium]|nr:DUF1365 family protein [Hyphomicrobiaceae bacterium]
MSRTESALFIGTVVHKRLRPRRHALSYSVFSCLFDCGELEELDQRLRLFSYNAFNLFSLRDGDHTDGQALNNHLRAIADASGRGNEVSCFLMLCYPRILGYAFNPLTVYFGLDAGGQVRLVIYEVNNTFGERKTYVLPAEPDADGLVNQECEKRFYVSPFNSVEGRYSFHATPPSGRELTVGVALKTDAGPLLKAHFRGERRPLSDGSLLRALSRTGLMTIKVIAGIHYEALRLWLKGLPLVRRPPPPATPVVYMRTPKET